MNNKLALTLMFVTLFLIYTVLFTIGGYSMIVVTVLSLAFYGSIAMIVLRYLVPQRATVVLRGVSAPYAQGVAAHSLFTVQDNVLGFPSGSFELAPGPQPNQVIADEWLPQGSTAKVLSVAMIPWRVAGTVVNVVTVISDSLWVYLIGQAIRVFVACYMVFLFAIPIGCALLVELVLKRVVRSRITVTTTQRDDEAVLEFVFSGVSAMLVKEKLLRAFDPPVLPARYQSVGMSTAQAATYEAAA